MKKTLSYIFSIIFALSFIAFLKTNSMSVSAQEKVTYDKQTTLTVQNEEQFTSALSNLSATSNLLVNVTKNLTLTTPVQLNGKIEIVGAPTANLTLGAGAYIDLKNGVHASLKNINIIKESANTEKQAVLFRENNKQGNAYFYNCRITVSEKSTGSALRAISLNGTFYLDNTVVSGGTYSCQKGSLYLSGESVIGSIEASVPVYDFRNCKVTVTPAPDNFTISDKVSFSISQKPFYSKGNSTDTQKFDVDIYYTLDGSDPVTSETAVLFDENTPVSLMVDRKIKATVKGKGICYSIGVQDFVYDVNADKTPANITAATKAEKMSVRCGTYITSEDLPEAVEITLSDGRKVFALADWDLQTVNLNKEGTYTATATLTPPYFISNTSNIKGEIEIEVYYNDIEDFTFTSDKPMQVGKDTDIRGYAAGALSAKGGDEVNFEYALETGDGDSDNDKFYIDGNQLKLKEKLAAGEYSVRISVTSGGKSGSITFKLEVADMAYEKKVVLNPYAGIDWSKINFVTSALHNHTFYSSAQFEESEHKDVASGLPDERIAAYKKYGYGAVVITEHDYVTLEYVGGYYTDQSILTLYGNELSKKYHTLYYGLEPYYDQRGKGASVSNGFEGNAENVTKMNGKGILYFAHPNRSTKDVDYWYDLFVKYPVVYGMEVFNAGQAQRNYSENVWDYILSKSMPERAIWGSGSDDAHSNSAIATGWSIMLLRDDEMNTEGLYNALKSGNSFISTICVNPETDDEIMYNNRTGDIPYFTSVTTDEEKGTVSVTAEKYVKLEWVSENGVVVGTQPTLNLNKTYGINKYVRCRIYGTGGMSHTQPIGIADGDTLYAGSPDEPEKPDDKPIDSSKNDSSTSSSVVDSSSTINTDSSSGERGGCKSSVGSIAVQLPLLLQAALIFVHVFKRGAKK